MMMYPVPIDTKGRLSLVTCPRSATLDTNVEELAAAGVTLVVSALPEDDEFDLGLTAEAAVLRDAGIEFMRIPVEDFDVPVELGPTIAALEAVLAALDDDRQHAAIHCLGGLGRSPMLAAALLVLTGDDAESVWRLVAAARRRPVPETPEQRLWVSRLDRD